MAADIAGYSKLVAEDEEETLRRLASYRSVFDDFIARGSGRVFNTAGDAVLAEFPSAVEAVRCAIDIQESLRTRNLAYPPSRQMAFRIGITIGDVVERDGDLLGDGVNIAARLEGLAVPGGICVSRTVYEQVANKLSVQFADIGQQQVKNIPLPIHAYTLAIGSDDGRTQQAAAPAVPKPAPGLPRWVWPAALAVVGAAVLGVAAGLYFGRSGGLREAGTRVAGSGPARPRAPQPPTPPAPQPAPPQPTALAAEAVPFVSDRDRIIIRDTYLPAAGHKALAINSIRFGFMTSQKDEETAKAGAIDACKLGSNQSIPAMRCEIYAVGNSVVYARGLPPLPPQPWFVHDPSVERPFAAKDVPLIREPGRENIERSYVPGRKSKALALSPRGIFRSYFGQTSPEEAARRALEWCGSLSGIACLVLAVDDVFVVPIPSTMKVVGFFHPATAPIAPPLREEVAQRLSGARMGWNAVAVGAAGHPGVALKAANEGEATGRALAECVKQDRNCRVIAIGPFLVEPN